MKALLFASSLLIPFTSTSPLPAGLHQPASPPASVGRCATAPRSPRLAPLAIRLGLLVATLSLLGGCVGFTEPVASVPGEEVDLSPFVGSWRMEQSTSSVVELTDAGTNSLLGTATDSIRDSSSPAITFTVRLTNINERIVASVHSESNLFGSNGPLWAVGTIELDDVGKRMTMRGLDAEVIAKAVKSGNLVVRQIEQKGGDTGAYPPGIDAHGNALRNYLRGNADAFTKSGEIVLVRSDSSTATPDQANGFSATEEAIRTLAMESALENPSPGIAYPESGDVTPNYPAQAAIGIPTGTPAAPGAAAQHAAQAADDSGRPASVENLLVALVIILFAGVVAAMAIDYLKERRRTGPQAPEGSTAVGYPVAYEAARADGIANAQAGGIGNATAGGIGSAAADGIGSATFGGIGNAAGREFTDYGPRRYPSTAAKLHRYAWPALLILAVTVGPILYLTLLLAGLAFPEWMPGLQPGAQAMLHSFAPYMLVFSIGAVIAAAEVATTFQAFSAEALSTKWAALLVLFNGLGTVIVYSAVMVLSPDVEHPLVHLFVIAVGFAVLIRTRFVLARDLRAPVGGGGVRAGGEGVSLDLGWPYARLQQMCHQLIERDLLRDPRYATDRLLARFPDTASLEQVATHTIEARDPSLAADLRARLDAIRAEDLGLGLERARVARFIVETGGLDHTRFLIEHADPDGTT